MIRPVLNDFNPVEFNFHPFLVIPRECNWNCDAVGDFSTKMCVPSKTKNININIFNKITRIIEVKTLFKYISCDFKCKLSKTT